ncbi:hypothetical protein C6502_07910 [Candidatus Poribacteria bacterium]|nr:MAG: hypothetical protein C6502_07910 [Candidatus Poribacteria bacterium]
MRSFSQESIARYFALGAISLLIVAWLCGTVSDALAGTEFGDITITPELQPTGNTFHGYAEYRIAVSNRSLDTVHQVTLILPKKVFGTPRNEIRELTRSVIVGPSATVYVSLLQPSVPLASGSELGVAIDGELQRDEVLLSGGQHARGRSSTTHVSIGVGTSPGAPVASKGFPLSLRILISRNVDPTALHAYADKLLSPPPSGGPSGSSSSSPGSRGRGSTPSYETIDLGLPVSAWNTTWLGFSRYDGIIVTAEDIRQMPPDVQSALWHYVECGGALFVLGEHELPESWGLKGLLKPELPTDSEGIAVYNVGFGQYIVSPATDAKNLNQKQWRFVIESWTKTGIPWQWNNSVEEANRIFPVVSRLGIPVRGLFLLMLLFAIVIGPVNLIMLSRRKRRIWLLWTTPVISLITCLGVFAYATFAEGWKQVVRTEGLTILDERVHRATTIGWTAFYSALTLGEGLHFGYETELTPQISARDTNKVLTVDWTHDQHLGSGWVTARVPIHFMVRKSETRRERVTVRRGANAGLRIVNSLGADISQFWLEDRDGAIYSAIDIPAGEEVELKLRPDLRVDSSNKSAEVLQFELWDPSINQDLNREEISPVLRDEMRWYGLSLSDNVTVSVQDSDLQWEVTDQLLKRSYNIKTSRPGGILKIHAERTTDLRAIFASGNWVENIERLKINPEKYLRPGCYIASLKASPFIEEGLQNVTEKQYSAAVYGILASE